MSETRYPSGLDPVLDLHSTLEKYFELSPDIYARKNYQHCIAQLEDRWQTVSASWDWLHRRMLQDRAELVSIGDCRQGEWWEDWGFVDFF